MSALLWGISFVCTSVIKKEKLRRTSSTYNAAITAWACVWGCVRVMGALVYISAARRLAVSHHIQVRSCYATPIVSEPFSDGSISYFGEKVLETSIETKENPNIEGDEREKKKATIDPVEEPTKKKRWRERLIHERTTVPAASNASSP